ncbi:syndecan-3-like [Pempheris klunzingeri]|uniref:syndecan-3-like n=1 Tax=Pempheris klunzingeri TaxID=3127111 RepID=UPI0039804E56
MRRPIIASLLLIVGLIHPGSMSFSAPPEDLEGSGYDLDTSGSGSGDWPEQDEMKSVNGGRAENTFHGSWGLTFDNTQWSAKNSGSGFVVLANSKSLLENKEIFAGVIAGGVTGAMLAAILVAIFIYKWQKKEDGGYSLGQQRAPDKDYHKPKREEVV